MYIEIYINFYWKKQRAGEQKLFPAKSTKEYILGPEIKTTNSSEQKHKQEDTYICLPA
jgi:hypothetical protein